jgi:glutamate receptor, ionotropic, invertebrate
LCFVLHNYQQVLFITKLCTSICRFKFSFLVSNIYTLPFRANVWFSCLVLVLISTILLYLTSQKDIDEENAKKQEKRFTDSVLSTIAALCQMDPSIQASRAVTSTRIIMFLIFLTFSFLYAAYTANIVSLLQSPSKSIRSMEDLYSSKIELAVEDTPYNRHYFANAEKPFEKKVYVEKVAPPGKKDHYIKIQNGVGHVRKGVYAIFGEETGIYKQIEDTFYEHEKCELVAIEFLKFSDPHLSIKKNSPYKEIIKVK